MKLLVSRKKVIWAKCLIWGGMAIAFTTIPFITSNHSPFSMLSVVLLISGLLISSFGIFLSDTLFHCPRCGQVLRRRDVSPLYDIVHFDDIPACCEACNYKIEIELEK